MKDANIVSGFGIVWHGYTPAIRKVKLDSGGEPQRLIETYDPARPDTPWIRRTPPWDTRIDPTASSFHPDEDARWAARRILMMPEQYNDDPMFARINVDPTFTWDRKSVMPHLELAGTDGPDMPKMIEIWEVYDKVNEIMFHLSDGASGKILTRGGEKPWPKGIPHEGLPYSIIMFNEQPDDVFPLPYERMIRPMVIELNKLETMMAELTKRIRRVILYRKDLMGDGEAESVVAEIGLKEFVEAKGGNLDEIIKEITLGAFPQELLIYKASIMEDIRETLGQSKFQRAQRENVESAEEAARIGMGDDTQVGRNQDAVEEFITDSVRKWHQGLQAVATDDMLIPILGEDTVTRVGRNAMQVYLNVRPQDIRGEFMFRMRMGSSRPTNEQQQKQEALILLKLVEQFGDRLIIDQHLTDVYLAFNKSPGRYMMNEAEVAAMQKAKENEIPAQAGGGGQSNGKGGPIDMNLIKSVPRMM